MEILLVIFVLFFIGLISLLISGFFGIVFIGFVTVLLIFGLYSITAIAPFLLIGGIIYFAIYGMRAFNNPKRKINLQYQIVMFSQDFLNYQIVGVLNFFSRKIQAYLKH